MTHEIPTSIRVLQLKLTTQIHIHYSQNKTPLSKLFASFTLFFFFHENVRTWQLKIKIKKTKDMPTSVIYTHFCLSITVNTTSHKMNRIFENSWRKYCVKPKTNHFTTIIHKYDAILIAFWHTEQDRPTHFTILFFLHIYSEPETDRQSESEKGFVRLKSLEPKLIENSNEIS